ncbi:cell division protein FtsZ [Sulfurimonas sp.]
MKEFEVTERVGSDGIKIVVIGVGGGGSNMVESLIDSDLSNRVKLVAVNTDAQALINSKIPHKLQIGEQLTNGKGSGMKPEIGKVAALESYESLKYIICN